MNSGCRGVTLAEELERSCEWEELLAVVLFCVSDGVYLCTATFCIYGYGLIRVDAKRGVKRYGWLHLVWCSSCCESEA